MDRCTHCMTSFIWKSIETDSILVIILGWECEPELTATDKRDILGWWKCSNCTVLMFAQFCKCTTASWDCILKCVNFMVRKQYLKKGVKFWVWVDQSKRGKSLWDTGNDILNDILTIPDLADFVNVPKSRAVKTMWYEISESKYSCNDAALWLWLNTGIDFLPWSCGQRLLQAICHRYYVSLYLAFD